MDKQEAAGWSIIILMLLIFYWLTKYGLSFLHGTQPTLTSVQSGIALPGGSQNEPTYTCDGCVA